VQSAFPTACQQCHSTTNWTSGTFNHSTTGFTLDGAHAALQCAQCHTTAFNPSGAYNFPNPTPCVTCHQADFKGTNSPNHVQAGFPTACQQCHTTTNWNGATFNHASTGFTIDGFHTTLQCTQCHTTQFNPSGAYNFPTPTPCVTCHQADFKGTNNPSHVQAGFPTTCQQCHTTTNWTGATFNHSTTGFTLTGFHTSLQCAQCHTAAFQGGPYNFPTPTPCVTCHQADFNGTTNPNHVQSGFPTACDQCHTTTNWLGATFNHASTGFNLTGFHATLTCTQCHNTTFSPGGAYKLPTPTPCITCHQADYNGTNAPPHAVVGFPTTCDACHNFNNWLGAVFNHNATTFPLTGYHATNVTCVQCHVNGNYTTLPTACYGCHQTDYNATSNPPHASTGFPTTCDTCHTTTAWTGATFNHTWFNVNHGNANGVCATCHTNPSDYSVFQCTGCHGGNNAANFNHPNVGGYVYNSVNCYQCHGKG
jgi:nitrate/TMAO reductase-like tetraheme cytochrome c subunit